MRFFSSFRVLMFLLLLAVPFGVMAVSAPTNLAATPNQSGSVGLTWTASTGATSYNVYRSTSSGGTFSMVSSPTSTSYSDAAVVVGTTYYYKVSAVANGVESVSTTLTPATFTLAGNASISGATATQLSTGSWGVQAYSTTGLTSAAAVSFQRGTTSSVFMAGLNSDPTTDASYASLDYALYIYMNELYVYESGARVYSGATNVVGTDVFEIVYQNSNVVYKRNGNVFYTSSTAAGRTFYFDSSFYSQNSSITNINLGTETSDLSGLSVVSAVISPSAPAGLTISSSQSSTVNLAWSSVTGATSYTIYRATSYGGTYSAIGTATTTSFSDATSRSATYWYRVSASASGTEGLPSVAVDAPPTGLSASTTVPGSVNLSWDSFGGASRYGIYRATSQNGSYAWVSYNITGTSYTDTAATPGTAYWYKVTAYDQTSNWSATSAPVGVAATVAGLSLSSTQADTVNLSWSAVTSATSYTIYRATSYGGTYSAIGTATTTSFSDATSRSATYWYRVSATVAGTEGLPSVASAAPPTGLSASATVPGSVNLSWDSFGGASWYGIYRATSQNGSYAWVSYNIAGTSYTDTTATPGTAYWYKVTAYGQNSNWSANSAPVGVAATVGGLALSSTQSGTVNLTWTAVASATNYTIYRSTSYGGTYSSIGTATTTSFSDAASRSATYWYRVSATVSGTEGSSSVAVAAPPTGLSASVSVSDSVNLTWDSFSGAASYAISRATSQNGTYSVVSPNITGTSYTDTTATPGSAYWYKVAAYYPDTAWGVASAPVGVVVATVTGLSASNTKVGSVDLGWTAIAGATYQVYRSTGNQSFTAIAAPSGNSYSDSAVAVGTVYNYKVSSIINGLEGAQSASVSGYSIPDTVTGLSVSSQIGQNGLAWVSVSSANSYTIYRATSSAGTYSAIGSSSSNSYTDTSNVVGTTYWYKVSATINGVAGGQSTAVSGTALAATVPSGLAATSNQVGAINLSWTAVSGATYKVYRSATSGGTYTAIASPTGASYSDASASVGVTYFYKVASVMNSTESAQSPSVSGYSIPAVVTGLTATNNVPGSVNLSWTSISGVTYKVYRSSDNVSFAPIATPSSNSYSDASVAVGTTYYYKVAAVINSTEGGQSSSVAGSAVSPIPSGLSATQGTVTGQVQLAWTSISGVSRYGVYRDGVQLGFVTSAYYEDALIDVSVHNYVVTAVNGSSESAPSAAVTGYANLPPTSVFATGTTTTDTLVTITPIISDPNANDVFTLSIATMPAHGGVSLQNGSFVYQSDASWSGVDGFDVTVADKAGASVGGHITVDVNGVKTSTPYRFILRTPQ